MKRKHLLALLLALVFVLASSLPAFAEEGEIPPVSGPEETVPVEQLESNPSIDVLEPEEAPEPEPVPDEATVVPDIAEESPVVPDDPAESDGDAEEDVPSLPEEPQFPGEEDNAAEPAPPDGWEASGEETFPEEYPPDAAEPEEEPSDEEPEEEPKEEESPEELIINVLVPSSGQVIINPYRIKVDTSTGETTEQIVHEPQALVNFSNIPVQVDVWAVGTLAGESEAFFVAAPPAGDAVDKEIFMYLEFQPVPDWWSGAYGDFDNQLLVTSWGEGKANVMTLLPGGEGWYRLSGSMTNFPSEMWQEEDAASVTVVFSFNPIPETPEAPEFFEVPASYDFPEQFETPENDFPEYFEVPEMPEISAGPADDDLIQAAF